MADFAPCAVRKSSLRCPRPMKNRISQFATTYVVAHFAFASLAACSSDSGPAAPGAPSATSATSACLLEGSLTLLGKTTEIKDCAQNDGRLSKSELEQYCEGLSQAGVQLGATPSKITYLNACPSAAQGSCSGARIIPAGVTAYYYKRDDLTGVKSSCETNGGVWK
jgi:hypothetical protein